MSISKQRNFGLDIIRTTAVVTVVYGHGENFLTDHSKYKEVYNYFHLDGVPIFFVLSGFLIGGILLKIINTTDFRFKDLYDFWIRRWFRTLPNYYLVLLFLIFYNLFMNISLPNGILKYFIFFQNFNSPHPLFYAVAWSLSVEEWFYLSIPFLLFISVAFIPAEKKKIILFWIITLIIVISLFRIYRIQKYHYFTISDWDINLRKQIITRLDSIMYGFFAAFLYYYRIPIWKKYQNLFFFLGILFIIGPNFYFAFAGNSINVFFMNYVLLLLTPLGTLLILPKLSGIEKTTWKGGKIITFISIISYSIYLLHDAVIRQILMPKIFKYIPLTFINHFGVVIINYSTYWVLTITLSYLLFRYYEKPMTSLRERIAKEE